MQNETYKKNVLGSQPETRPYTPVEALPPMSLHDPPACARRLQPTSKSCPTMAVKLLVAGVNWQLKLFSRQLHAGSFGVGGRVVDAPNAALEAGQDG